MMAKRRFVSAAIAAATASAYASALSLASPPGSSYRLVFADEFNGTSLDTSKWTAASPNWTMPNSDSVASASQVSVGNGVLTLSATRTSATGSFTSGSISSYNKFNLSSGYIEASIQLPSTPGSWPAFWGLYTGWPPEADIMEYPITTNGGASGLPDTSYNTNYHYTDTAGGAAAGAGAVATGQNLSLAYHTFGMQWVASTSIAFYLDGTEVSSYTGSSVSQMASMYTIFDYAVGGWPGTPNTTQWAVGHTDSMKVDWVRMWQTNPNNDATSNWTVNGGGAFSTAGNWTAGVPQYGNETAYFGRVGTAQAAAITMSPWQMFGGITFDGLSTGSLSGATAYTLGASGNAIQLASTTGGVNVTATTASTVNQTIDASIELWSNTDFVNNMTGGESINANGGLSGNGNLSVDGVGSVILSGTGTFSGTTTLGSLANGQGPAVLVANANNALSTGTVTIGPSGNATTARLDLMGGYTLPNSITLAGRNTNSVGIENLSGNNTLSGAITASSGGGTYDIQSDAGNLTLSGGLTAASGSRTFTLQGAGNGLITGPVQNGGGTVSLSMAGPGTWTLSGSNTFSGATAVTAGNLILNNVGLPKTSGVTVSTGAELTAKGSITTAGTLTSSGTINLNDGTIKTLSVSGGLSLTNAILNLDVGSASSDRIAAGGAASGGSNNTINISPVLGQGMVSGNSYTVLTAASGLSAANFKIGTKPASLGFFNFGLSTPTAAALLINVTGNATPTTAYWTGRGSTGSGDTGNNWGAGASIGTSNWSTDSGGQTDAVQVPGSITNVIFSGTNAANSGGVLTTQLDSAYPVNGLTFNVPAATGTTSTILNTNGNALTIGGGGVSVVSTSNSSATLSGTGSILLSSNQGWANNNGTLGLNVSSNVAAMSGSTTLTFGGTGTGGVNLSGILADGGGTLSTVFNQAGTTILSASNTYSGTTTVASGTLQINSTGQIVSNATVDSGATLMLNGGSNSIGASNGVNVLSGGTLDVRGATAGTANAATIGSLGGGGVVTRGNTGLTTLTVGSGSFSGTLQDGNGQLAFIKSGAGALTLSGSSSYSGGTTINDGGGTLAVTSSGALGIGSVTVGNGSTNQTGELQLAGGVAITSVPAINFESRSLSNAGGSADIENLSGNNSISANLNINNSGGSSVNILSSAGTLTLSGHLSSTGLSSARGFDFFGAGNGRVTGIISDGTSQQTLVQMDGPGTWTLSNNNTYTGGTTVNGGTLVFSGNNNFGGGGLTVNAGVADLAANNTYSGTTTIDSGTVIMASPAALGSSAISFVNGGISGGGTLDVQTNGGDTQYGLNLSSGNEMTLDSDVQTGSIGINHTLGALFIGRLTTVYVMAGANVQTGNPSITLGTVTLSSGVGGGTTTFDPTTASVTVGAVSTSTNTAKTLDLDGNNTGNVIAGAIIDGSNVMTLVKSNTSAWTLSHSSSYSGGTTINDGGGTLAITASGALGIGSVIIGNGGSNQSGELQLAGGIAVTSVPTINFACRLLSNAGGSPDIENLSGANSISANLNINTAGGNAVNILSTAGSLTLSGSLSSTGLINARAYDFYGAGNGVVSGIISDGTTQPIFIQKDGTGTWTLTRSNTFTGGTTINGGKLLLDQGGWLKNSNISITAGTLAAGTTGTGGTLNFNLAGNTADLINLSGTGVLDLTNMKLNLAISGTQTQTQYVIANQDVGSSFVLSQQFASVTNLPSGWSIDYGGTTADPGDIVLATPEPSSVGLIGLGFVGLLGRRRRSNRRP
jgi:fibronectin-binding autotransporter adhesin